jgi:hypothetical protein
MLGYLRMCIEKTGAITTTDWLEALEASKLQQVPETNKEGNKALLLSELGGLKQQADIARNNPNTT